MAASTANYTISRGIFYWTPEGGTERDLGNVSACAITPNVEFLDHYSSRAGVKGKDLSVPVQIGAEISMTLDEWQVENIAMALLGTVEDQTAGDPGGAGKKKVKILTGTAAIGKVRFVGTNTVGVRVEAVLPRVSFKAGTSLSLISDEWNTFELSGEVLYDEDSESYGDIYQL